MSFRSDSADGSRGAPRAVPRVDPELVAYLEEMLEAAKGGDVLYFVASAGVIAPVEQKGPASLIDTVMPEAGRPRAGELQVRPAAILGEMAHRLAPTGAQRGFNAVLGALAGAVQAVQVRVAQIDPHRGPAITVIGEKRGS